MRSLKPHWSPGKTWIFYWDEQRQWVMMRRLGTFYFDTFEELQAQLNFSMKELIEA